MMFEEIERTLECKTEQWVYRARQTKEGGCEARSSGPPVLPIQSCCASLHPEAEGVRTDAVYPTA